MVRNGCIYLIRNIHNGKMYVGQHYNSNPERRFYQHCHSAIKGKSTTCILANAIRKYGVESFKLERLGIFPIDSLDNMECYYAEQFGTYTWDEPNPGYNMIWCGGVGRMRGIKPSQETKDKMSKTRTGKAIHDQSFKDALAKRNSERVYTEEIRKQMSETAKSLMTGEKRKELSEIIKKKYEEDEFYRKNVLDSQRRRRENETEGDKERYRKNTNKQFSSPEARERHRQIMLKHYENKRNEKLKI
jgi:group I intron endonuclease